MSEPELAAVDRTGVAITDDGTSATAQPPIKRRQQCAAEAGKLAAEREE